MTSRDIPTFGIARIITSADGRYRPDASGEWAAIVPVRDRYGEPCDLVAWFPDNPQRWWLRLGEATPILGTEALALAAWDGRSIDLHSTPESWLISRAGDCIRPPGTCTRECETCSLNRGACVLRWDVELSELFEGVKEVKCNSPELETRLRRALRRWEPTVSVGREVRHAA